MWINVDIEKIPTWGMHRKKFKLHLINHCDFYGHDEYELNEVVTGIWDSIFECFFEEKTGKEIFTYDIAKWWKEEE